MNTKRDIEAKPLDTNTLDAKSLELTTGGRHHGHHGGHYGRWGGWGGWGPSVQLVSYRAW